MHAITVFSPKNDAILLMLSAATDEISFLAWSSSSS